MTRWKAAGAAPRDIDDALWAEFRGIQDDFFNARSSVLSEQDAEFKTQPRRPSWPCWTRPRQRILPVSDLDTAKAGFRTFLEKYNAYGRVPREQMRTLDARVKALETAVRSAEEDEWRRTDPQARARAEETVAMLASEIDKLTEKVAKADARGDNVGCQRRATSDRDLPDLARTGQDDAGGLQPLSATAPDVRASLLEAEDVVDARDLPDRVDQVLEVLGVGGLEGEPELERAVLRGVQRRPTGSRCGARP